MAVRPASFATICPPSSSVIAHRCTGAQSRTLSKVTTGCAGGANNSLELLPASVPAGSEHGPVGARSYSQLG